MPEELSQRYRILKATALADLGGGNVARLIGEMALQARQMLQEAERVQLISHVESKSYFSFRRDNESRPINESLYAEGPTEFGRLLNTFGTGFPGVTRDLDIIRAIYTISYSVFAANDVYGIGRKASATFFEILIGHIFARTTGVSPRKRVRVPESGAELPTDYVFDPGPKSRKLHLPIKTSTRERAVQAWVHQLVLDRIFGTGTYQGILVVASETKRNSRTGEVVEICVPKQLQMFQARVAEISRIYYLDPPQTYLKLAEDFPRVDVKSLDEAFGELRAFIPA